MHLFCFICVLFFFLGGGRVGLDFRISTSALEEVRNPVVLKKDAMNVCE